MFGVGELGVSGSEGGEVEEGGVESGRGRRRVVVVVVVEGVEVGRGENDCVVGVTVAVL